MDMKYKVYNYMHLGLQTTFLYLTFSFVRALLHELGHGVAAVIVGLEFPFTHFFYSQNTPSGGYSIKVWGRIANDHHKTKILQEDV